MHKEARQTVSGHWAETGRLRLLPSDYIFLLLVATLQPPLFFSVPQRSQTLCHIVVTTAWDPQPPRFQPAKSCSSLRSQLNGFILIQVFPDALKKALLLKLYHKISCIFPLWHSPNLGRYVYPISHIHAHTTHIYRKRHKHNLFTVFLH